MTKSACIVRLAACVLTAAFVLNCAGCSWRPFKKKEGEPDTSFSYRPQDDIQQKPQRLIADYRNMLQHDTVKWVWIDQNFNPATFRPAVVQPVKNFSEVDYRSVEQRLDEAVRGLFSTEGRAAPQRRTAVMIAIVDIVPKQGMFKRLFTSPLDRPGVEIELVIYDEQSRAVLCKICHSRHDDDFERAFERLILDLREFFGKRA